MEFSNPLKGMIDDLDELNYSPSQYKYALNAYVESVVGDQFVLQNGASNLLGWVFDEGEDVVGKIYIVELESVLLFTTLNRIIKLSLTEYNDTNYNINLGDVSVESIPLEQRAQLPILTSTILVEKECLNWKIQHKIDIEYKITDRSLNLYFVDGYNEDRYVYFDIDWNTRTLSLNDLFKEILSIDSNGDVQYGDLSCNRIKFHPEIPYPQISTEVVEGGKLDAGVYQVLVSFATSKGISLTPYKGVTNPEHIFTKDLTSTPYYPTTKAIRINISDLDTSYRYYEFINIVVLSTIEGVSTYNLVATLPIYASTISWVYTGSEIHIRVDGQEILTPRVYYRSSRMITKGNNVLLRGRLKEWEKVNIQRISNLIKLNWVTVVAEEGDYKDPEFAQQYRSNLRDETYSYGFKLIYDNGEESHVGHIPGRVATDFDRELICREFDGQVNRDVFNSDDVCHPEECKERWKIYNTASQTKFYTNELDKCGYKIHAEGEFGYVESSDTYPNDPNVWGDLAGTPIRHHKFPDCLVSPIHDGNSNMFISYDSPKNKIYPIGVKLDDSISIDQILKDAVSYGWITEEQKQRVRGYKIVRGNRLTHKSIEAKGLLYDTFSYQRSGRKYHYPNYPFNDLRNDSFISGDDVENVDWDERPPSRNIFVNEKRYTFHSPNTHFNSPTIPSILKIENETFGESRGFFNKSEDFSEYVLLDQGWYNLAIILGVHVARGLEAGQGINQSDTGAQIGGIVGTGVGALFGGVGAPIGGAIGTFAGRVIGGLTGANKDYFKELQQSMSALSQAEKFLQLFQNILKQKNYHYQYQAIGRYSNVLPVQNNGNKQRKIKQSSYLDSQRQTIGDTFFNNWGRESSVFIELEESLPSTTVQDVSRFTISESPQGCDYQDGKLIDKPISSFYVSLKRELLNQYGNIFSIEYIPVSNTVWKLDEKFIEFGGDTYINAFALKRKHHFFTNNMYNQPDYTDVFYDELSNAGYTRYFFNTRWYQKEDTFFGSLSGWDPGPLSILYLAIQIAFGTGNGAVDGLVDNLGRFDASRQTTKEFIDLVYNNDIKENQNTWWQQFVGINYNGSTAELLKDFGQLFKRILFDPLRLFRQPLMNLDCLSNEGIPTWNTQTIPVPGGPLLAAPKDFFWKMTSLEGKIYTYSFGIPYFICESDINVDLRYARGINEEDFYPRQKDLSYWTQQKNVNPYFDNTYFYNNDYSKQNKEEINIKFDINFFKNKDLVDHRNRVIYSLQGSEMDSLDTKDNFLYHRPLDMFDFKYENGFLTSIDGIENENILVRFEHNTRIFSTVETLKTGNGNIIELGTGSLFGGTPQEYSKSPTGFLGSQHTNMLHTEHGHIIVDSIRGHVIKLGLGGKGVDLISNKGKRNWFKNNLPFHIKKTIKNVDIDNEYNDIGIVLSYNKRYDCFHLTKKDYIPLVKNISYLDGKFYLDNDEIFLRDEKYFKNASWTISYNFLTESWVSYHSFLPNYYIDLVDTFYLGLNSLGNKSSSLWVHNLTNKSFQVYFGKLYPFIVEGITKPSLFYKKFVSANFLLSVLRYHNEYDEYSLVEEPVTFNKAVVYNERQNSGLLELHPLNENDPLQQVKYPVPTLISRIIGIEHKESLYSFNQFEDVKKNTNLPSWIVSPNGVDKYLNQNALDYSIGVINNSYIENIINYIMLINDKYSNYKFNFRGFVVDEKDSVR